MIYILLSVTASQLKNRTLLSVLRKFGILVPGGPGDSGNREEFKRNIFADPA